MKISFNLNNTNNHDEDNNFSNKYKNKIPKVLRIMILIGFSLFFGGVIIDFCLTFITGNMQLLPIGIIVSIIGFAIAFISIIISSFITVTKIKDFNLPSINISKENENSEKDETSGYEIFRCPSCGAMIDHNIKKCTYCGCAIRAKKKNKSE